MLPLDTSDAGSRAGAQEGVKAEGAKNDEIGGVGISTNSATGDVVLTTVEAEYTPCKTWSTGTDNGKVTAVFVVRYLLRTPSRPGGEGGNIEGATGDDMA